VELEGKPDLRAIPIRQAALPLACALGLFVAVCIVLFPGEAREAALRGIAIWWKVLFPALFPFLVLSEVMLGFGIVHFLGALFDPLMRPLFRVPGIGGFAMAMGFASGYPVSAKLVSQLRAQRLVPRVEGERLVAFSTTSDPLFLIGAVSIGFFQNPGLAAPLAAAHYGSAFLLGLGLRYYGRREEADGASGSGSPAAGGSSGSGENPSAGGHGGAPAGGSEGGPSRRAHPIARAFRAMHAARLADGRPIGRLLQDAVTNSLPLVMTIGGLVVFFSVLMEMLGRAGVLAGLHAALRALLEAAGFPSSLAPSLANGLFEVTLGAQAAGEASAQLPLRYSAAAAAFVLSWAGLSVHAQAISLMSRSDLRYRPFVAARLLHGVLSAALIHFGWPFLAPLADPAFASRLAAGLSHGDAVRTFLSSMGSAAFLFAATLGLLLGPALIAGAIRAAAFRRRRR